MNVEEKILARIAELEKMRNDYIVEVNKQVAAMNAAIAELRALIELPEQQEDDDN